jgi:hypothetical protein
MFGLFAPPHSQLLGGAAERASNLHDRILLFYFFCGGVAIYCGSIVTRRDASNCGQATVFFDSLWISERVTDITTLLFQADTFLLPSSARHHASATSCKN